MATNVFELFATLKLDSSDYESGLNSAASKAGSVGGTISRGLGTAMKLTGVAVSAAGAGLLKLGKDAVSTGSAFDQAMGSVAATTGKTVDELGEEFGTVETAYGTFSGTLRDFAMFMGQNTVFSATEAAQALNYMALAGYDTQKSMGMLPSVLSMAAAGSMELARASDVITDIQSALGLSFEETNTMVDEFAKAAASGNTSVEQLGDAFLRVGGLARELNGGMVELANGTQIETSGVEEMAIALTAMANAGIKGAEAGTHMRNMILKLSNPTDAGAATMETFGIEVFDTEGKMRSLTDIMQNLNDVMNGSGGDAYIQRFEYLQHLINDNGLKMSDIAKDWKSIGDFEFITQDDEGNDILKSREQVEAELEKYVTAAGGLTQKAKLSIIGDLFNTRDTASIEALLGAVQGAVVKVGDEVYSVDSAYEKWGDAIYDSSQGFEIVENSWGNLASKITDAEGSAAQMSQTRLDNLKGDITLMQSALETAKITINDQLSPTLREFTQFGTEAIQTLTTAFSEGGFDGAMEAFGGILADGLNMIIEKLPDFIDAAAKLLKAFGQGIADNLPVVIDAAVSIAGTLAETLIEGIPGFIDAVLSFVETGLTALDENLPAIIDTLNEVITKIIDSLMEHGSTIFELVVSILTKLGEAFVENLPMILETALTIVMALADGIMTSLPTLIPAVVQMLVEIAMELTNPTNLALLLQAAIEIILALAQGLINAIPELIRAIPQIISNLVGAIVAATPELLAAGIQLIVALGLGIIEAIPELLNSVFEIVPAIVGGIVQGIKSIIEVGGQVIEGFVQGIKNAWNGFITNIVSLFTGFIDRIKGLFGIHSPSTVFSGIGKNIIQGMINGISNMAKTLLNNVLGLGKNVITYIKNGLTSGAATLKEIGSGLFSKIGEGFKGMISGAATWGKDLIDTFTGGIKEKWGSLKSTLSDTAGAVKDFLGFSEPKEGPLSNFHTYAPDMMELFAKGIRDNEHLITDQIEDSFDVEGKLAPIKGNFRSSGGAESLASIVNLLQQILDRDPTYLEVDEDSLYNVVRRKNNQYTRMYGVSGI